MRWRGAPGGDTTPFAPETVSTLHSRAVAATCETAVQSGLRPTVPNPIHRGARRPACPALPERQAFAVPQLDERGGDLAKGRIADGLEGVAAFHAMVADHADAPGGVVIGIETDRGLLVGALVPAGYQVYAVNPLAASRYRERHATSRAKSDRGDAKVLADLVCTDCHNHRRGAGNSELIEAVRVLARPRLWYAAPAAVRPADGEYPAASRLRESACCARRRSPALTMDKDRQERQRRVAELLADAERAHGEYEARELQGVFDHRWAQWYADYLVRHGLGLALGTDVTPEQLARWLTECDAAYQREPPAEAWPAYYAQRLVDGTG